MSHNTKDLIEAALGKVKADLVVKGANLIDVFTGEVIEKASVASYDGFVVRVIWNEEDLDNYVGPTTTVIDARGQYLMPGLIDSHLHVESSLLNVREFSKLEAIHGVTAAVVDPHEVANVLGYEGVRLFIEEARRSLIRVLVEAPSCVPAIDPSAGIDGGGAIIGPKEVRSLLTLEGVVGLGELMDFRGVLGTRSHVIAKVEASKALGKVIDGHAPGLHGAELDAYMVSGASSDHESSTLEEALEKARKGMYVFLRYGSIGKDLEVLARLASELPDTRRLTLVADDINVIDLVEHGHMDYIVSRAIELGIDPVKAIQMATINPAQHLRMDDLMGAVAPGRYADMVLSRGLERISVSMTIVGGRLIYANGRLLRDPEPFEYPSWARNSVKVRPFSADDLVIMLNDNLKSVRANVISVRPGSMITLKSVEELSVEGGIVRSDASRGIMHVAVIDRHKASGRVGRGFIKGLPLTKGALAQTIAHDTHNLIVAGYDPKDMELAARAVVEAQGGIAYAEGGRLKAMVRLPIAGLMSDESYERVYDEVKELEGTLGTAGSGLDSVFMVLAFVSLPVIPELRITDMGLVDVKEGRVIDVIVDPVSRAR